MGEDRGQSRRAGDTALLHAAIAYAATIAFMVLSAGAMIISVQLAHRGGLVGGAKALFDGADRSATGGAARDGGGAQGGSDDRAQPVIVEAGGGPTGLKFVPERVEIEVGQTVLWRNVSFDIHTVTADPGLAANSENVRLPEGAETFNSGRFSPDETFTYTFETSGEYRYFCIPHEATGMVGEVVVRE